MDTNFLIYNQIKLIVLMLLFYADFLPTRVNKLNARIDEATALKESYWIIAENNVRIKDAEAKLASVLSIDETEQYKNRCKL
jgi:hypothetical protein